jgi:hypothetical protein
MLLNALCQWLMPNATGGKGVPRYVKQTPEQQQQYYDQLQSTYEQEQATEAQEAQEVPAESA